MEKSLLMFHLKFIINRATKVCGYEMNLYFVYKHENVAFSKQEILNIVFVYIIWFYYFIYFTREKNRFITVHEEYVCFLYIQSVYLITIRYGNQIFLELLLSMNVTNRWHGYYWTTICTVLYNKFSLF